MVSREELVQRFHDEVVAQGWPVGTDSIEEAERAVEWFIENRKLIEETGADKK